MSETADDLRLIAGTLTVLSSFLPLFVSDAGKARRAMNAADAREAAHEALGRIADLLGEQRPSRIVGPDEARWIHSRAQLRRAPCPYCHGQTRAGYEGRCDCGLYESVRPSAPSTSGAPPEVTLQHD